MPLIYIGSMSHIGTNIIVQKQGQSPYEWDLSTQGHLNLNTYGLYTITVPSTLALHIKAWGAAGGHSLNTASVILARGGAGGYAGGYFTATAGTYLVWVGQGGNHYQEGVSPFGGGGRAIVKAVNYYTAASGGGLSGIFRGSISQANALIIAGAGAGASGSNGGGSGQTGATYGAALGGGGATTSGPGIGGTGTTLYGGYGVTGAALQGADSKNSAYLGGAGGGGYYGGGSGCCNNYIGAGGGGGSCYCAATIGTPVILNSNFQTVGNASDPERGTAGDVGATSGTINLATTCGHDGALVLSLA